MSEQSIPGRSSSVGDNNHCYVLIIGAGIVGICTAYCLKILNPELSVTLTDTGQPMALTSTQSGENYRNWWPHPIMTAFTDHSVDLMEALARDTGNRISMNRRGYILATRANSIDLLIKELIGGYHGKAESLIRFHDDAYGRHYSPPVCDKWSTAPSGVDVINSQALIRRTFPSYEDSIKHVVHIRRAGSISAQQMGQYMLEQFKAAGGRRLTGRVHAIDHPSDFRVHMDTLTAPIQAQRIVNDAGPYINTIAAMLGTALPVRNVLQQKIAFADTAGAIPRDMPFSIDLDAQDIDWSAEERELLLGDPDNAWFTEQMPGSIHCRPDGGDNGSWIKLGWAFNQVEDSPSRSPVLDDAFPEIVVRGAARLNPLLKQYYERFPRGMQHYGGYYTLTDENWPLIGEMGVKGSFVVGAMSGFGTMAACAAGDLCARHVCDQEVPAFARSLSLQRYDDRDLMDELKVQSSRGIL